MNLNIHKIKIKYIIKNIEIKDLECETAYDS